MAVTPNLNITHVDPAQNNKTVTLNEGLDELDEAIAGQVDKDCTAGGTITLIQTEWANLILHLTGTPAGAFNIVVPINKKPYLVKNDSGQTATVKTPSGTGVDVATGQSRLVRCDGTNVILYMDCPDIRSFFPGVPGASAMVFAHVFARQQKLPASLPGSRAILGTAATASTTFTINKNGVGIGSFNFGVGGTVATFTFTADVTFNPGDILTIVGPNPADATAKDLAVTLLIKVS